MIPEPGMNFGIQDKKAGLFIPAITGWGEFGVQLPLLPRPQPARVQVQVRPVRVRVPRVRRQPARVQRQRDEERNVWLVHILQNYEEDEEEYRQIPRRFQASRGRVIFSGIVLIT